MKTALAALVLLLSSCGTAGVTTGGTVEHPTGRDEAIVRVEQVGGFVPAHYHLRQVPSVVILGDLTMVVAGPQIEIYPGPALPNLLSRSLTEEAVQKIIEAAQEAGLMEGNRTLRQPTVADAPTTVFTISAGGETHRTEVEALGIGSGPGSEESGEREEVLDFFQKVTDPASWLPEGAVGDEEPFRSDRLQVVVQPQDADSREAPEELEQASKPWPLDVPAGSLGDPFDTFSGLEGSRCATLEGEQAEKMYAALADSNELTPWVSGEESWIIYPKPLLGGEPGCDHPLRDPVQSPES